MESGEWVFVDMAVPASHPHNANTRPIRLTDGREFAEGYWQPKELQWRYGTLESGEDPVIAREQVAAYYALESELREWRARGLMPKGPTT